MSKDLKDLPPLFLSYLPIILPVVLISFISLLKVLGSQGVELGFLTPELENENFRLLSFLGEPNTFNKEIKEIRTTGSIIGR